MKRLFFVLCYLFCFNLSAQVVFDKASDEEVIFSFLHKQVQSEFEEVYTNGTGDEENAHLVSMFIQYHLDISQIRKSVFDCYHKNLLTDANRGQQIRQMDACGNELRQKYSDAFLNTPLPDDDDYYLISDLFDIKKKIILESVENGTDDQVFILIDIVFDRMNMKNEYLKLKDCALNEQEQTNCLDDFYKRIKKEVNSLMNENK